MKKRLLLGLLCSLGVLQACSVGGGSSKVLYHTLGYGGTVTETQPVISKRIPSLGVGPIKLTSLLDRKGFVMRRDDNTVEVSNAHEWGGELEDEFLAALAQQLQARLPQTRIQRIPWEITQTPKYQVSLIIDQFDGQVDGQAVLRGSWQLQHGNDGRIIATHPAQLNQTVKGKKVEDIVLAQTQLVQALAKRIVASLASL